MDNAIIKHKKINNIMHKTMYKMQFNA